tara:strand:- start:5464 stop:6207 length:744 start_codon:yes stop_codon:yes gene_type:complete
MWVDQGPVHYPVEVDERTRKFFEENEFKEQKLSGLDKGLLYDENDPNKVIDNTLLPWIPVPIEVPHKEILEESMHLLDTGCFTAHRPDSSGWLSVCIHGMSSVHTNCPEDYNMPDEMEDELSTWTDIARYCPRTVEWMKDTVCYEKYTRVRYMAVLPDGWLMPHVDRQRVTGVGATNVAINNPEGCKLVMKDWGEMPFDPGKMFKINTGYEHAVWNRSDEPRIHMIFDGDMGDYFKSKVLEGYKEYA